MQHQLGSLLMGGRPSFCSRMESIALIHHSLTVLSGTISELVATVHPSTLMPNSPSTSPAAIHRPWMFEVERALYIKRARYLREKVETDVNRSRKLLKNKEIPRSERRELEQAVADSEAYTRMLTRIITGNIRPNDTDLATLSQKALKQRISEQMSKERRIPDGVQSCTVEEAIRYLYDPVLGELVSGEFLIFETLATPEAGRYVLTPDLAKMLGNTTVPSMPLGIDLDYYARHIDELLHLPWYVERLRDLKLPHPYMTVRIPAFTLEQPTRDGIVRFDVPETDVVFVSRPIVTDFMRRMGLPESIEKMMFFYPGHYPLIHAQRVCPQEQLETAPNPISLIALTPFGPRGMACTPTDEGQPEAIREGNEVGHLMAALLMLMNEPRTQTLERFGRTMVDPSVDRPSTKRRPPSRLRYEVLGTRTRFTSQVPGTARGPQTVRSFVRGHWARWPLMSQNDRLFQLSLDCLTLLDDRAVRELVPEAPLDDPQTYAAAIRACLGDVLDQDISRRSEDVAVRFLCTLLTLDERTPGLSQLRVSPAWAARASVLDDRLREICRQRRSYKEPHWRGPEGAEEVSAVTILDRDSVEDSSIGTREDLPDPPSIDSIQPLHPLTDGQIAQAKQLLLDSYLRAGHVGDQWGSADRQLLLDGPWWEAEVRPAQLVPREDWSEYLNWLETEERGMDGYRYEPPQHHDQPILVGPEWAHAGPSGIAGFVILDGWHRTAAAIRDQPETPLRIWITSPADDFFSVQE